MLYVVAAALSLGLVIQPAPPLSVNAAASRVVVNAPAPLPASALLAEKASLFPPEKLEEAKATASKVLAEQGPVVAAAATKAAQEAVPVIQSSIEAATPVLVQTGKDLAPIAKQALDVVGPVALQGATVLGTGAFELAKSLGSTALDALSVAANEAGAAASAEAAKQASTVQIDPSIKSNLDALGKAAVPILSEGVKQATPYVNSALKEGSKAGAAALKKALTNVEKELDVLASESTPSSSQQDTLAALEAERQALLAQLN